MSGDNSGPPAAIVFGCAGENLTDDEAAFFGDIRPAFGAAERGAAPHAAGHQLERTGGYFLAVAGDADNHALAPAFVATLQRLAHDLRVADAFERVIRAAIGELDDVIDHVTEATCLVEATRTRVSRSLRPR